jgi:hypothetical protein
MRKGIAEGQAATVPFTLKSLKKIENEGYKFVQVKGLTADKHFDYIEPHCLILVPMRELPTEQEKKDIYEPVNSKLLEQWATEEDDMFRSCWLRLRNVCAWENEKVEVQAFCLNNSKAIKIKGSV